jgi:CHRD domain
MRKRWVTALVALGLGAALGIGIATATAGGGNKPTAVAAPAATKDLGQKFGTGMTGTFSGSVEVPAGDPDASGTALIRLNVAEGLVCFKLTVRGSDPLTAAHIHQAPAGVAGPVVVPLTTPTALAGDPSVQQSKGCVSADPSLIATIKANPSQFYANVHDKAFPAGVVRAQLRPIKEKAIVCTTVKPKKKKK